MLLKYLLILILPSSIFSLQFFLIDTITTNMYDYKFETIIKLECKLPDINKINTTVFSIYDQANTKFPLPASNDLQYNTLITNEYYVHLSLVNTQIQKIMEINKKFTELQQYYTQEVPSPYHQSGKFEVSEKFLNDTLNALDYLNAVTKLTFDKYADWAAFKANAQSFTSIIIQFRFMQETLSYLFTNLDSYYEAIKQAKQNIITDRLASAISTFEYNTPKTDIKIISSFIRDGIPTYYIKKIEYHNQKSGNKLFPVYYNNFGLEEGYLFDPSLHKYIKPSDKSLSYKQRINLNKCLTALNSENFNDTLKFCEFQYNPSITFTPTNEGVLLHKASQLTINAINNQLNVDLAQSDLPAHITFDGDLSFIDMEIGLVSFKRNSARDVEESTFSHNRIDYMTDYLRKKEDKVKNNLTFPEYVEDNYVGILIDISAVGLVVILVAIVQKLFFKSTRHCKRVPMENSIIKMVRKNHA